MILPDNYICEGQISIWDYMQPNKAELFDINDNAKILSLFDGMACGMLAMIAAGVKVERYVSYEIDKYATQTSKHNFPMMEQNGDVFKADFTQYKGFDYLVGGSPCTYWSIAQTKNRETVASGMGWELFSQYVRALKEAQPRFFIYENNKSMSAAIKQSISETFGFEPICINSALVSAQNRQRLYWVGIRQADGTYKKADIQQPEDREIYLKDILETPAIAWQDKAYTYTTRCQGAIIENTLEKHQHTMVAEPVSESSVQVGALPRPNGELSTSQAFRIYSVDAKSVTLKGCGGGAGGKTGLYAVPAYVAQRGRYDENGEIYQHFEPNTDNKTNTLTTVQKDNLIAEPINITEEGKARTLMAGYYKYGMATMITNDGFKGGTTAVAMSSNTKNAYEVKDGLITVKGKQYPIKLVDGFYIIRKLTIKECMRLQTVPEWYVFPVSNSQAYKMLGNGWTVEVIAHLIKATIEMKGD